MAASTNPNKDIFTTHEVSKLLQVNPRSVINWIEQDLLNSYRTPGGHRRISREDLLAFLRYRPSEFDRHLHHRNPRPHWPRARPN